MQILLDDLELDLKELKYLIGNISLDPALKRVMIRRIREMHKRLDDLNDMVDSIPDEPYQDELSEFEHPIFEAEPMAFDPVKDEEIITDSDEIVLQINTVKESEEIDDESLPEDYKNVSEPASVITEEEKDELSEDIAVLVEEEIIVEADAQPETDEPLIIETVVNVSPEQTLERPAGVLGDRIKPSRDLRKSISLNDSFRYSRELFGNNISRMNKVIQEISVMQSLNEVLPYLYSEWEAEEDNEAAADFMELLKKYFY